ncbi:MAG TPA: 4Fe-4S dicluster domain-containing protein, partial [Opitutus sp.]|nr:4Fe-4S dicluster domain-containing protein [Opitutus sp.]
MVASQENFPLLAELLAEQQRLDTPVARFSTAHDAGTANGLAALRAQLIPLSAPAAGEHYAFEVDLDACTGCKACVTACHSLNGLDETETWRDVGLIVGGHPRHPVQQTVTSACHHCADPACLNGCPVLAYEKDPATGIVRHLDDQCIGCQYCILKCPYDAPKYNARLGIVRKCDLCHGRLAAGEAPACAQACPTHAIRIVTVPLAARADTSGFLRAAPDPAGTRPTTRYRSRRAGLQHLRAADANALRPQPAHWPLVIMLTLLSLAVGCEWSAVAGRVFAGGGFVRAALWLGWAAGVSGLGASVAHLGRPERAWRIFLGWRRRWLSREAVAFAAWLAVASAALAEPRLAAAAAVLGSAGLFCSVMIYVDTRRVFWRWGRTAPRF